MKNEKYCGIIPAFYACYDDEGNVSPERTKAFTKFLMDKGVKGLYVCGSSGECIYQSKEERKLILESVMNAVGGKMTIIAHVACNNTKDSCELARHAEALGVDAIATIPPIYFKLNETAIAKYWNDQYPRRPITQSSSWISGIDFDPMTNYMSVQMNGKTYGYGGIDPTQMANIINSQSIGYEFNKR